MIILNTKFRLSSECGKDVFLRRFQQHLQNDIRWSSLSHLEDLLTGDYSGEVDGNTIHAFTSDDAVVISLHRSYDETDQDFVYLIDEESPHLSDSNFEYGIIALSRHEQASIVLEWCSSKNPLLVHILYPRVRDSNEPIQNSSGRHSLPISNLARINFTHRNISFPITWLIYSS